jgi:hypothetical protein
MSSIDLAVLRNQGGNAYYCSQSSCFGEALKDEFYVCFVITKKCDAFVKKEAMKSFLGNRQS